tara:strand:- start:215 stop:1246 length:1032 start_codon:yes stop_codon:yes gene_type:complete
MNDKEEPTKKELTGPQKAAIFLMSLGEETAAKVLAEMDDREIQQLGNHMSSISEVDDSSLDTIRKEFYNFIKGGSGGVSMFGLEFLRNTLMKALDPEKAAEILENISSPDDALEGGLDTVKMLDPKTIANFLSTEHPQTAAIIMAHLEPSVASTVIKEMPEDQRTEVVHRLATLERVSPMFIRQLDEALQHELRASTAVSGSKMGGVENAAKMMGKLDRETENSILTKLDETDPDLATEIRNLRFVFEDLVKIDDFGMQAVLKEVNQEDLLVGLKTASDELKEKIYSNMSERASVMLKEDLEALGPKKLSEVEEAQGKVIAVCKKMEDEGKLVIGGSEEDQYV